MDTKTILKWLYIGGALVAALAGAFRFSNDILTQVLIIIGVVVGLFYFDSADLMNFGIRYLVIAAVAASLNALIFIGPYLTGFFTGFVGFLGPVVLAMAVMFFVRKYFGKM